MDDVVHTKGDFVRRYMGNNTNNTNNTFNINIPQVLNVSTSFTS
jgi:hypothetical protein